MTTDIQKSVAARRNVYTEKTRLLVSLALEGNMSSAAQLFDAVQQETSLRTDAALAEAIGIEPANLSRLRHGYRPVSAGLVLRIHEITGWPIRRIKADLGMPCHAQVPMPP